MLVGAVERYTQLIRIQPIVEQRGVVAPEFTYPQTDDDSASELLSRRLTNATASAPGSSFAPLPLVSLELRVLSDSSSCGQVPKQLDDDESYTLYITPGDDENGPRAIVEASTVWGILYGMETFSQLPSSAMQIAGLPLRIADAPRYPWRGLLLDTANHVLSIKAIERTIDGLSAAKMNTLHWHIVDSYSFPFHSDKFPEMAEAGAWGQYANDADKAKFMYSPAEVSHVVDYARVRGLRVVMEVDVPGHAYSWGMSEKYRDIVTKCPAYTDELGHVDDIPLDISRAETMQVVEGLLSELSSLTPDSYLHIGGDEVKYGCWAESPSIRSYMKELGIADGDYFSLEQHFFKQVHSMAVAGLNRRLVAWEEVFFDGSGGENGAHGAWVGSDALPADSTVIEIWTGADYLATALDEGYDGIMAYGWYLDRQNPVDDEGMWFWADTWGQMYSVEPEPVVPARVEAGETEAESSRETRASSSKTNKRRGRALGGDASIWTEMTDAATLDTAVWPRAAAVGERLWSPRDVKEARFAAPRLSMLRCRMAARYGIRAHPIWSDSCSAVDTDAML